MGMSSNIREMRLKAEDIACISCAEDMERILKDKDGVIDVTVSYDGASVVLKYDAEMLSRKEAYFAVRKLGYPLKIVSEK
jgi:copper chaperone CopZ